MTGLQIEHYCTPSGRDHVRDFLDGLDEMARAMCENVIDFLRTGEIDRRPKHRDNLGHGLWELRVSYQGNQYRILYCVDDGVATLLHGFMKKTQQTPKRALDLGRKRMAEVQGKRGKQ